MGNLCKGRVAFVTGAGRGIGREHALMLASEGAKVIVNDLGGEVDGAGGDLSPAQEVVAEIESMGGEAIVNGANVADFAAAGEMVQQAIDTWGRLDILINNAGILRDRMVFSMAEADFDAVINVHLKGTFTIVKHASIIFRQQRSGRIITFSSQSGLVGNSGQANYGAAKDGIAGFTRVVARDMGRYGVTANSISPSAATRMTVSVPQEARDLRSQRGIGGAVSYTHLTLPTILLV